MITWAMSGSKRAQCRVAAAFNHSLTVCAFINELAIIRETARVEPRSQTLVIDFSIECDPQLARSLSIGPDNLGVSCARNTKQARLPSSDRTLAADVEIASEPRASDMVPQHNPLTFDPGRRGSKSEM
jgi:hypothetical protein